MIPAGKQVLRHLLLFLHNQRAAVAGSPAVLEREKEKIYLPGGIRENMLCF